MLSQLRYALRTLRNQPAFTIVAVCSLAIGIGANTAIYSFADAFLLRPIPVRKPSRVVDIGASKDGQMMASSNVSYPDYVDLRNANHSFSGLVASAFSQFGIAPGRGIQPRMRMGMLVSGNFFEALGIIPELGRAFLPSEDSAPGRDPVVILSHDAWISDFGADPSVVGRRIFLNGTDFTVVGVAPKNFSGIELLKVAAFVPLAMSPKLANSGTLLTDRSSRWLEVRGRLKDGIGMAQAQSDVSRIVSDLRRSYPATDATLKLIVQTELQMREEESPPNAMLVIMLGLLAICVLLVACGNVAGLLVSRAAARTREFAVRLAMGAKRSTLINQLLVESLLLALAGGVAGLLIAWRASLFFNDLPFPGDVALDFNVRLDQRALLFTFAVSLVSTVVFGLAPAFRGTRLELNSALKERAGTGSKRARLWGRSFIVSAQVALSLVLLIVSAVLVQGFRAQFQRGPGFRIDGLQLMSFDTSLMHYTDAQRDKFYKQIEDNVRLLPGVRAASLLAVVPLGVNNSSVTVVPQGLQIKKGERPPSLLDDVVGPNYFQVFDIPIVTGRSFAESDRADTPAVAIVNEEFTHHYWPNQNPIGKTLRLNDQSGKELHVIGVAKTTKYVWITEQAFDFVYLPRSQNPQSDNTLAVLSSGPDPSSLVPALRALVHKLDPNMPIFDVQTMRTLYQDRAILTPQYIVKTVTALGTLSLILSCIGLYGIVSYTVGRRTREFGVRIAVGARRQQLLAMVLSEGFRLGIAGMIVGLLIGNFVSNLLQTQVLFSFASVGWLPYAAVCTVLLVTISLAGFAPAHRASTTDPVRALRDE